MQIELTITWQKWVLCLAALSAFFSVALGAFGAHYFKTRLSEYSMSVYEVGVRYQFYHTLGVMLIALTGVFISTILIKVAAVLMLMGIVIFSGSLYLLAFTDVKSWGAITPIGGLLFLLAWLAYLIGLFR